ncbi:MAG: hypothetical protein WBG18_18725 [Xanthobacteraceae bacterium]
MRLDLRKVMRAPTYPRIVALALMLVAAPSFSAFAQRGERDRILEERTPLRTPEERTPLRTQTFGGHVYHGQLAWRDGRWHHATRDGRDGWWWDVGGFWYFYPEQIEGPPDYVSDVEVADNATTAPPAPPEESSYAVYYFPGDLTGTRYQTLEECLQAREQAGNVGECIAY